MDSDQNNAYPQGQNSIEISKLISEWNEDTDSNSIDEFDCVKLKMEETTALEDMKILKDVENHKSSDKPSQSLQSDVSKFSCCWKYLCTFF